MNKNDLWVFGYGSLIWHPGFAFSETSLATLVGYRRSFCMRSIHHRGTEEKPGLVLALDHDPDATCTGLAFRVKNGAEEKTISYLRERELISSAYLETQIDVELADGRVANATTFVVDRDHIQYCHGVSLEEQARIISSAVGQRGRNAEYLHNTVAHLAELGINDDALTWLDCNVRTMAG